MKAAGSTSRVMKKSCVYKVPKILVVVLCLLVLQRVYVHSINSFANIQNIKDVFKSPVKVATDVLKPPVNVHNVDGVSKIQGVNDVFKTPAKDVKDAFKLASKDVKDVFKSPAKDVKDVFKSPTKDVKDVFKSPTKEVKDVFKSPTKDVKDAFKSPTKDVKDAFKSPTKDVKDAFKSPTKDVKDAFKSPTKDVKDAFKSPTKDVKGVFKSSTKDVKDVFKSPTRIVSTTASRKKATSTSGLVEEFPMFRDLYAKEVWPEISRPKNVTSEKIRKNPSKTTNDSKSAEGLPLYRDIYAQQKWPEISRHTSLAPGKLANTVHYIWCGRKREFRFQHYLGILSIIRLLQPLKLIFHYTHMPVLDEKWYHVWFWELQQSYASLELRPLKTHNDSCDSQVLASTALDFLAEGGGIYVSPNIVVTRFPKVTTQASYWFTGSPNSPDIVYALKGFDAKKKQEYLKQILAGGSKCGSIDAYNQAGPLKGTPCLKVTEEIRPKHVITAKTPFSELARWLYYGKREVLEAKQSTTESIPRIAHFAWLKKDNASPNEQLQFGFHNMLSMLSALHVAGLRHVYVHGDHKPSGKWWDLLQAENVTFVPMDTFRYVFQQHVGNPSHRSDVIRTHILQIYGGVYQDGDVMWVNRLPEDLFRYPTTACLDWPSRGEWPATFNIGVLMSRRQAPWLTFFLASMRKYLDWSFGYNAIMLPYKTYESHPETLHIDDHLQVICFREHCHPTWQDNYQRDILDSRPPKPYDWLEARSYHFTVPKPPKSLTSPEELKNGHDLYAKIGRRVLTMSGRGSIIGKS